MSKIVVTIATNLIDFTVVHLLEKQDSEVVLVIFRKLHIMERIVLSFGLSIAIVSLIVLAPNRAMGVPITATNTLISTAAVIGLALLLYALRKFQESRARNQ